MSIFKRKSNHSSNDYYDSYKEKLGRKEKKEGFFSLSTIIKIETATILVGIIFMGYNNLFSDFSKHFSIEFNPNALMSQSLLPKSNDFDVADSELMVQMEESENETSLPLEITEEKNLVEEEPIKRLAKKLNVNLTDLSLIVEIIKSEMSTQSRSREEDSIVIGQL